MLPALLVPCLCLPFTMHSFLLFLLFLLPLSCRSVRSPPARLLIRPLHPPWVPDLLLRRSVPNLLCPSLYPDGFTLICDPSHSRPLPSSALFVLNGRPLKRVYRSLFGPYHLDGYIRAGRIVWDGARRNSKRTVIKCKVGNKVLRAVIEVGCRNNVQVFEGNPYVWGWADRMEKQSKKAVVDNHSAQ